MFHRLGASVLALGIGVLGAACSSDDDAEATFTISSPAFANGQKIPDEYTCIGKNFPYSGAPPVDHTSPELHWTAGPAGTMSYAIVFRDMSLTTVEPIDERGYHYAIYNIPASVLSLPKGLPSGNPIPNNPDLAAAKQYSGALFNNGFLGPCPDWGTAPGSPLLGTEPAPTRHTDNYTFTVYAMPTATITEPAMRAPTMPPDPAVSYTKDLDDYFALHALGKAQLATNSDAEPAMFVAPPAM
jgi:phosphatidylethanolamine-binding protein (PEBP) family uncharacterized protein